MVWSGRLWENHNVQLMQLWRSRICAPSITTPTGIYTPRSRLRRESCWLQLKTPHTSILYFPQAIILILTPESLRPAPHHCSWPEMCSSLFYIFDKINRERSIICDRKSPPQYRWALGTLSNGKFSEWEELELMRENIWGHDFWGWWLCERIHLLQREIQLGALFAASDTIDCFKC